MAKYEANNKWILVVGSDNSVALKMFFESGQVETADTFLSFDTEAELIQYAADNGLQLPEE